MRVVNPFGYPERLILDPMKNTADPDPGGSDPRSRGCDPESHPFFRPLIPDPIYLVTTLEIISKVTMALWITLLVSKERSNTSVQMEGHIFHQALDNFSEETVSGIPLFSFRFQEFHSFLRTFGSFIPLQFLVMKFNRRMKTKMTEKSQFTYLNHPPVQFLVKFTLTLAAWSGSKMCPLFSVSA